MEKDNRILEIKDLHTHFHTDEGIVKAVNGASLTLNHKQTLGIVGESGCGKSVLSRSILRIVPAPGEIVNGQIIYHRSDGNGGTEALDLTAMDRKGEEIRAIRGAEIAMIFQEPMASFSPVHTIGNQISESIMLHQGVSKDDALGSTLSILKRVGMPNPEQIVKRFPFQLSGGMRQRAMIAMGLSCHPKVLIADEPTTALDVTTQAQILELMKELQEELEMAIIFITHDLGVISHMTEYVCVMYLGEVVEAADIDTIFYDPKHPYTRSLLQSIPRIGVTESRRLEVIKGSIPSPYMRPSGCPFHPRCAERIPGVCDRVIPEEVIIQPGHRTRCHLYSDKK